MTKLNIYLLHGKGGSPAGSVSLLEAELRPRLVEAEFVRPKLLHHDPGVLAEVSLENLVEMQIPNDAVVIGVSLGGLLAAKLQERGRDDLRVFCISAPTWADGVKLERRMPKRVAIYSSNDEVIAGRASEWPQLAKSFDVPELSHDTDLHKALLARMILDELQPE